MNNEIDLQFPAGWTYEIFWLATTASGASADCALLRWDQIGQATKQTVAVIDAGRNKDDLENLYEHLREEVGTTHIDYLIGTHSDRDHIGNFPSILESEEFTVGELWVHDPRNHLDAYEIPDATGDQEPIVASISDVHEINRLADSGMERREPFAGLSTPDAVLTVLGPSMNYYRQLLPRIFDRSDIEQLPPVMAAALAFDTLSYKSFELVLPKKPEGWQEDNLADSNPNRPSNDVSVISLMQLPRNRQILFTGDASSRSFDAAEANAAGLGLDADQLWRVQLPHHASWNNASSEMLDGLLGPICGSESTATELADDSGRVCIAQVGGNDPHHPSVRVANASIRRGWNVLATGGRTWKTGSSKSPAGSRYQPGEGSGGVDASPYSAFDPYPDSWTAHRR